MTTNPKSQAGASLIELLVGITIGLLTVTVVLGSIIISRGISGTVSDASQLQQQAAHIFRIFGQQIRQTASLRLNLAPNKAEGDAVEAEDPVAFEIPAGNPATGLFIKGNDSPASSEYHLSVGYQNYNEPISSASTPTPQFRNCLSEKLNPASAPILLSNFYFNSATGTLECAGNNGTNQPLTSNIANFSVQYLVQSDGNTGVPRLTAASAAAVTNWSAVVGVEACIEIYGTEPIDMPAGSSYVSCNGTSTNMTTLASGNRKNRLHMTFRNVYQLRSQGVV